MGLLAVGDGANVVHSTATELQTTGQLATCIPHLDYEQNSTAAVAATEINIYHRVHVVIPSGVHSLVLYLYGSAIASIN